MNMSYFSSQLPSYAALPGYNPQPVVAPLPVYRPTYTSPEGANPSQNATEHIPRTANTQNGPSWPQSLRKYVERAFSTALEGDKRLQLQRLLKEVINEAQQAGELWTKNWDATPLPSLTPRSTEFADQRPRRQQPSVQRAAAPPIVPARNRRSRYVSSGPRAPKLTALPVQQAGYKMGRATKRITDSACRQRKRARSPEISGCRPADTRSESETQGKSQDSTGTTDSQLRGREQARARRFGTGTALGGAASNSNNKWIPAKGGGWNVVSSVESESKQTGGVVRGTSLALEKSYFRLTAKPDPSTVRPETVLEKALIRLVQLIKDKKVNYFYASDQFKGMRQDCTVQHIKNELSASIYEAHARSALEHGDIGEYNQCQGQLMQHYSAGIIGCRDEFQAYRILYQAVHASRDNRVALLTCLQSLRKGDDQVAPIRHALQTREALVAGDFVRLCKLYSGAPNMNSAFLDIILPKVRFAALKQFVKVYAPSLPVRMIALWLGFSSAGDNSQKPSSSALMRSEQLHKALPGSTQATYGGRYRPQVELKQGEESCRLWLKEHGAVLISASGVLPRNWSTK